MHRLLLTNSQKEVVDVHGCFSRSLHKQQASVLSICLSLLHHTQHHTKWICSSSKETGKLKIGHVSFLLNHTQTMSVTDDCIGSVAISGVMK